MNSTRYGIFLRPDPETSWAVTRITDALHQQYGLTAAAAFAPHATLIGNLQSAVTEKELVLRLDGMFSDVRPLPVYNHGVRRSPQGSYYYDINLNRSGTEPNQQLFQVASAVRAATLPLHVPHNDFLAPNVQDYTFAAHLTLAGFELHVDSRLSEEVGDFIQGLLITAPTSFVASCYTLFEFHADWSGHWWNNMPWRHIKSWDTRLEP